MNKERILSVLVVVAFLFGLICYNQMVTVSMSGGAAGNGYTEWTSEPDAVENVVAQEAEEAVSELDSEQSKEENSEEMQDAVEEETSSEETKEDVVEEESTEAPQTENGEELTAGEEQEASEKEEASEDTAEPTSESDSEEAVAEEEAYVVEPYDAVLYAPKKVNVRKGPSTDYDKIGALEQGTAVEVVGKASTGWLQIRFGEELAFVSQRLLVEESVYLEQKALAEQEAQLAQQQAQQQVQAEQQAPGQEAQPPSQDEVYQAMRDRVVALMNEQRAAAGIGAISQSGTLNGAAQQRAVEIVQSFAHTRPNGSSCFTILDERGIGYMHAGENIAMGYVSAEDVMNGWMNSEGHRANILNGNFSQVGIGVYAAEGGQGFYWVQIFTN